MSEGEVIVSGGAAGGQMIRTVPELLPFARFNPDSDALQAFVANTGGGADLNFGDLTTVKTPSGGGLAWTIETPGRDPEAATTIEGILVFQARGGILWPSLASGTGDKPVLVTRDMRIGKLQLPVTRDEQGKIIDILGVSDQTMIQTLRDLEIPEHPGCFHWENLPYSQFGSGRNGQGKFVKEGYTLVIQRKDGVMPLMIRTSASAIKPIRAFLLNLTVPYWRAVVKIGLRKETSSVPDPSNPGKMVENPYSVPVLTLAGTIGREAGDVVFGTVKKNIESLWNSGSIDIATAE